MWFEFPYASAEIASVGNAGLLGVPLLLGGNSNPNSAVVQTAGISYRLSVNVLLQEFKRGGNARRLLLRYTQALMTQVGQTAACNRHHSIEQRLCRWLLLTLDRQPPNEVVMAQELVAGIFGVRRDRIAAAAGNLQRAGVLSYRRQPARRRLPALSRLNSPVPSARRRQLCGPLPTAADGLTGSETDNSKTSWPASRATSICTASGSTLTYR